MTKMVAIYCRVSTGEQNVQMQLNELRAFCGRRSWTIVGEYCDTSSGAKESRPSLNRLMADARRRKFGRKPGPPPFDVEAARAMLAAGQSMAAVGAALGVSAATICRRMASTRA